MTVEQTSGEERMVENNSVNYQIEQNAWQEIQRTMKCLSDQPFFIKFIRRNTNNDFFDQQNESIQSENTNQSDSISSSNLKTANDEFGECCGNVNEVEQMMEPTMKLPLCNNAKHLQDSNIAKLNQIFNTDQRKTIELSSHCKEIINRELTFWHDRIQFEMKQAVAIRATLHARMERIKRLNEELRNLLNYFNDDTDNLTLSSTGL